MVQVRQGRMWLDVVGYGSTGREIHSEPLRTSA